MLVCPFQTSRFSLRGRQVFLFLFVHIVGVLFLPAVRLCRFELGSGKAPFFAVPDAEIFLLCLVLPFAVFIQRAHRQQDVSMGIVPVRIMNRTVGTHSVRNELLPDKLRDKGLPFLFPKLYGQSNDKFTGKAAVLRLFCFFHGIP